MEVLGKILGTPARVKIMRLFLLNKDKNFTNKEVIKRTRTNPSLAVKEVKLLKSAGFVKKRASGWYFNQDFKYTPELEGLIINTETLNKQAIFNIFKKTGKLKFLAISGVFLKDKDSRVDLLLVGDKMKRGKIEDGMRKLEAEIGTELTYAIFETKDFNYRLNMYDKLVRDILDFPYEVVFETKELSTQALKNS